jgi:hypothetical protein
LIEMFKSIDSKVYSKLQSFHCHVVLSYLNWFLWDWAEKLAKCW